MPRVVFTANLQRHAACPPCQVAGATAGAALEQAFALYPRVRDYVLDEHGALRRHMLLFVNGQALSRQDGLGAAVADSDEIVVMQALSGG
jgi:molybdopterin converting factor small subunit